MEAKINIVEILKHKPQGTKLYSSACGKCRLVGVDDKSFKISFYNSKFGFMNGGEGYLDKNGKLYDDGECVVFPSKEMRNWSKFAWKKGDVLVGVGQRVIFEKFIDENYTKFQGKYSLSIYEDRTLVTDRSCYTSNFSKINDSGNVEDYFKDLEEKLGGKFNRETLEIEKTQPEFKDGDIVCISGMGYLAYGIVKSIDYSSKKLEYYVLNDMSTLKFEDWLSFEDKQTQPITETQQIILFDALAKEGKAWDSEKKAIVNLKQEVELKPFDKVLVKDNPYGSWEPALFWKKVDVIDLHPYMVIGGKRYRFCEPYEGNEHLLDD